MPDSDSKVSQLVERLGRVLSSAELRCQALPHVPEISLYLVDENYYRGRLPDEEVRLLLESPPYWIFCWASGQAFARYLLDRPCLVKGKRVLDIGSGSGIAAIAAAQAGASQVVAVDIDPDARLATEINASVNNCPVSIYDSLEKAQRQGQYDLVIATDVLYDRDNYPLLEHFRAVAPEVLVADSRVRNFSNPNYQLVDEMDCLTFPDLGEHEDFRRVRFYQSGLSAKQDAAVEPNRE